jgi:hypothetical protein
MLEGIFGCQREEINSLGLYIDICETELVIVWMFIVRFMVCIVGSVWCTGMSEWHSFPLSMDVPLYPACFTVPLVAVVLFLITE